MPADQPFKPPSHLRVLQGGKETMVPASDGQGLLPPRLGKHYAKDLYDSTSPNGALHAQWTALDAASETDPVLQGFAALVHRLRDKAWISECHISPEFLAHLKRNPIRKAIERQEDTRAFEAFKRSAYALPYAPLVDAVHTALRQRDPVLGVVR